MFGFGIFTIVFFAVAVVFIFKSIYQVPQQHAYVVERMVNASDGTLDMHELSSVSRTDPGVRGPGPGRKER